MDTINIFSILTELYTTEDEGQDTYRDETNREADHLEDETKEDHTKEKEAANKMKQDNKIRRLEKAIMRESNERKRLKHEK